MLCVNYTSIKIIFCLKKKKERRQRLNLLEGPPSPTPPRPPPLTNLGTSTGRNKEGKRKDPERPTESEPEGSQETRQAVPQYTDRETEAVG